MLRLLNKRFSRWTEGGGCVGQGLHELVTDRKNQYLMIDSTDRRKEARTRLWGVSKGGLAIKIHLLPIDCFAGRLPRPRRQVNYCTQAVALFGERKGRVGAG